MQPDNSEHKLQASDPAQQQPLLRVILRHMLIFGLFGPLFGCLFALLAALAVTFLLGGLPAFSQSMEAIRNQPWQWFISWFAGSYAYGVIPAFLTGAWAAWLSRKAFKRPRFVALVLIAGWALTAARFFTMPSLMGASPADFQILAAFVTGAVGALSALMCLILIHFLRNRMP